MSLPKTFSNPSEYFTAAIYFLKEFSWIYKYSNTSFIEKGCLDEMPVQWVEYFKAASNDDLNKFPEMENGIDRLPISLKKFQLSLHSLKLTTDFIEFKGPEIYFRKVNRKKLHEISRLSKLIIDTCNDDIDIMIDFGSGLGYLSEILFKHSNYHILGIECDKSRVETALNRQKAYYSKSTKQIFYKSEYISESTDKFIVDSVKTLFPNIQSPTGCIIGLHSCADLSVTSIKLFFHLNFIRKLIIMPCCYHKLKLKENNENEFKNFPISDVLKKINNENSNWNIFNRPFLRLACQETSSRWKIMNKTEHLNHGYEMYLRALVQTCLKQNEFVEKKKKVEINCKLNSFDIITEKYILKSKKVNGNTEKISWNNIHQLKFNEINDKYSDGPLLAEILTCLQTSLQSLCENLVLYDRICYIEEQSKKLGLKTKVSFKKIMDDKISPRCFALIAEKL